METVARLANTQHGFKEKGKAIKMLDLLVAAHTYISPVQNKISGIQLTWRCSTLLLPLAFLCSLRCWSFVCAIAQFQSNLMICLFLSIFRLSPLLVHRTYPLRGGLAPFCINAWYISYVIGIGSVPLVSSSEDSSSLASDSILLPVESARSFASRGFLIRMQNYR